MLPAINQAHAEAFLEAQHMENSGKSSPSSRSPGSQRDFRPTVEPPASNEAWSLQDLTTTSAVSSEYQSTPKDATMLVEAAPRIEEGPLYGFLRAAGVSNATRTTSARIGHLAPRLLDPRTWAGAGAQHR